MTATFVPLVGAAAPRWRFDVTNHHGHYEAVITVQHEGEPDWQYREHFPYLGVLQRELTRLSLYGVKIELWIDGEQRRY